jgi:hypothetical protein
MGVGERISFEETGNGSASNWNLSLNATNSNNEILKMKNEKLWKGSALTRLYMMPAAGPLIIHYSFFIIHLISVYRATAR